MDRESLPELSRALDSCDGSSSRVARTITVTLDTQTRLDERDQRRTREGVESDFARGTWGARPQVTPARPMQAFGPNRPCSATCRNPMDCLPPQSDRSTF